MSITKARTFMEKSGCGLVVGIGLALVIIFGLIYTLRFGDDGAQNQIPEELLKPVATVGSRGISAHAVDRNYQIVANQQLSAADDAPVTLDAFIYGSQINGLIEQAARLELATRKGIKLTDDEIIQTVGKQFDEQVSMMREQYKAFGMIKPNATEEEVQKVLAANFGGDIAAARSQRIRQAEEGLKDPATRSELELTALGQKLLETYASQVQLTEEELKTSQYETVFKRISFKLVDDVNPAPLTALDIKERQRVELEKAQKVLDEIKGGLSFEAAMEKYSDDPAPAGKKKSDATVNLTRAVLDYDADYAPLKELKPGEVSPVIYHSNTGEWLIFKMIEAKETAPKDFETNKAALRKNRIDQIAATRIFEDAKKLAEHDAIKWTSPGFKALHHWFTVYNDVDLLKDPADRMAQMEKVYEEAKAVDRDADAVGSRAASMALFASIDTLYDSANPAKKAELRDEWAAAAVDVLENAENANLRIELARVQLEQKSLDDALANLVAASQANAGLSDSAFRRYREIRDLREKLVAAGMKKESLTALDDSQDFWASDAVETLVSEAEYNDDYTETGRTRFGEINRQLKQLKGLGLIKPEDVKKIEEFQNKWKVEKIKYDEEQAKELKRQEEEAKKAAEEAKKKADEEKKTGAPPSSGSTTSGAPSSSDLFKGGR